VSHADLLIAVDTGGTKTAAWLVDLSRPDGERVLGQGQATAGNPLSVGFAESTRAIAEAITRAREAASLADSPLQRAILSIAGAANELMTQRFVAWAHVAKLAQQIAIVSDVLPVLAAGTPNCCGIALISGTGSVAFGRSADGKATLCGGWGYLLGDEGSGYAISRAALQHALRNLEAKTTLEPLSAALLGELKASTVTELTRNVYSSQDTRRTIAALAPLVIKLADAGEAIAQEILDAAAIDLAKLVARTVLAVGLAGKDFSLALGGGVLVGSRRLKEQLNVELRRLGLRCETKVVEEPLEGCIRLGDAQFDGSLVTWHKA
jgi:N-acetylglucosamine kinase-like BadF-type ATPase